MDLLLTHHDAWPFVFGLGEACEAALARHGMAHAFFHAPLDDAPLGTAGSLAAALELRNREHVMPYGGEYLAGIVGDLPRPCLLQELVEQTEALLGEGLRVFQNRSGPVTRLGIATGGGNMTTEMRHAVERGCDCYLTGEYVLYTQQYARLHGMNLLVGSHTGTERPGIRALGERLVQGTGLQLVEVPEPLE